MFISQTVAEYTKNMHGYRKLMKLDYFCCEYNTPWLTSVVDLVYLKFLTLKSALKEQTSRMLD